MKLSDFANLPDDQRQALINEARDNLRSREEVLAGLNADLADYEQRFGITSEEFEALRRAGKIELDMDAFSWVTRIQRKKMIESSTHD
jgi:hypothetical protein